MLQIILDMLHILRYAHFIRVFTHIYIHVHISTYFYLYHAYATYTYVYVFDGRNYGVFQ
jgi:hypothetical protein